jgi:hypothetical protein
MTAPPIDREPTIEAPRPGHEVMKLDRLGAMWPTRYSFSHCFLRTAARRGFEVKRVEATLDDAGRGRVIYHAMVADAPFTFLVLSDPMAEAEQQDRIIATRWDARACLFVGQPSEAELIETAAELFKVIWGRASPGTAVWSRANRSARLFDHVVESLAAGRQPDPRQVNRVGYLIRTTSFSTNGRNGTIDFARFHEIGHPLCAPYHVQMLACYLWREFGIDLAEHFARARNPRAVPLSDDLRRYMGVGNSSGIGLVPFVVRHPRLVNAWIGRREGGAAAMRRAVRSDTADARLRVLLAGAVEYFRLEPRGEAEEFSAGTELAADLLRTRKFLDDRPGPTTFAPLMDWARASLTFEAQELLQSLLLELHEDDDAATEILVDESLSFSGSMRVAALLRLIRDRFAWIERHVSDARAGEFFWYLSEENMEPRRGVRGVDDGETYALPVDFIGRLAQLMRELADAPADWSIGRFLVANPDMRFMVGWTYTLATIEYAIARMDLLATDFSPLKIMRFQLAMYGMLKFRPRSKTWLRATILQGAGLPAELARGHVGDGLLPVMPAAS